MKKSSNIKVPKLFKATPQRIDAETKMPKDSWNLPPDGRPMIHVNSAQIKELATLEVGEEYTLEVKIKVLSKELTDNVNGDSYSAKFAITEYKLETMEQEASEIE